MVTLTAFIVFLSLPVFIRSLATFEIRPMFFKTRKSRNSSQKILVLELLISDLDEYNRYLLLRHAGLR
jgi:hypothetical protein